MTAIALDLGSTEFRSIRHDGQRLVARKIPTIYSVLEDNASNRRLLEQSHLTYAQADGAIIVLGSSAKTLSALIRCPVIPVVMEGHLPWNDPVGRQVCATFIEALVPHCSGTGTVCALTLPDSSQRRKNDETKLIEQVLRLRGYQIVTMNSASSLALAELADQSFTGVSLVVGAESVSVSVTYLGKPVFEQTFCQGFRSIEQRFAISRHRFLWDQSGNRYFDLQSIRNWIQESQISLTNPATGDELWLAKQYAKLLSDVWASMLPDLMRVATNPVFKHRLTMTVAGGATSMIGFDALLMSVIKKSCLPFKIQEIRHAANDPFSVSRGLLIHATMTQTVDREQSQPNLVSAVA